MPQDPLTALVVDEADVAREELATGLRPYVRLTSSGGLLFEPAYDHLPALARVCCILLALRAAHLLGLREAPNATPKDLVEVSGMPAGTVRPKLAELVRKRLARATNGAYEIPIPAMRSALQSIQR